MSSKWWLNVRAQPYKNSKITNKYDVQSCVDLMSEHCPSFLDVNLMKQLLLSEQINQNYN